mmetsp:Transcript_42261/g.101034  ORF Transcript_42261/g.101034 Transcript_42261/m.101034 type:complete len:342 (+) Transcript_42261:125-1150(+)
MRSAQASNWWLLKLSLCGRTPGASSSSPSSGCCLASLSTRSAVVATSRTAFRSYCSLRPKMCCSISRRRQGCCSPPTSSCSLVMQPRASWQSSTSRSASWNLARFVIALCVTKDVTFGPWLGTWWLCSSRQDCSRKSRESESWSQPSSCLQASSTLDIMRPEASSSSRMVAPTVTSTPGDCACAARACRYAEKSAPLVTAEGRSTPSPTPNSRSRSSRSRARAPLHSSGATSLTSARAEEALSAATAARRPKTRIARISCARLLAARSPTWRGDLQSSSWCSKRLPMVWRSASAVAPYAPWTSSWRTASRPRDWVSSGKRGPSVQPVGGGAGTRCSHSSLP